MKRTKLFSSLLTAALGIVMAGPASAGDNTYTWVGNSTDWDAGSASDYTNWDWDGATPAVTSLPEPGDSVIIPDVDDSYNPEIDSAVGTVTFSSLVIDTDGVLSIVDDGVLVLDGSTTHDIDGHLQLNGTNAILRFTTNDVTVDGSGFIRGFYNSTQIEIDNVTLTNEMTIRGMMVIEESDGTATFVNGATGTVKANADGGGSPAVLRLASGLTIDDADGAKWQAKTDSDAVLQFDEGASCLEGDFLINDCATLKVDGVAVKTKGTITKTAGRIVLVNSGTLFENVASNCTGGDSVAASCFGDCGCP